MLATYLSDQRATGGVAREVWPPAVEQACTYLFRRLDAAPTTAISLKELAGAACVTPEHLCRLFKAALGHTPAETVRLARLERAAMLLVRSNYSVAEVADLCGFANPFHFSRAFKASYGESPTTMRRRVAGGADHPWPRLVQSVFRLQPGLSLDHAQD
jgi:transcriptional regulator GlxA family with amidase domain